MRARRATSWHPWWMMPSKTGRTRKSCWTPSCQHLPLASHRKPRTTPANPAIVKGREWPQHTGSQGGSQWYDNTLGFREYGRSIQARKEDRNGKFMIRPFPYHPLPAQTRRVIDTRQSSVSQSIQFNRKVALRPAPVIWPLTGLTKTGACLCGHGASFSQVEQCNSRRRTRLSRWRRYLAVLVLGRLHSRPCSASRLSRQCRTHPTTAAAASQCQGPGTIVSLRHRPYTNPITFNHEPNI
jgi:hypothetical protein